jgi:hypothetical protein
MRLDFNRSGTRLLVPSSNRIHIVDHSGRTPVVQVMQSAIREVAGVGDEVWVVAGDTALHRYDLTGAPIAAPTQLPGGGGRGRLHPLRGPHTAAVWTAIESTMLVADGPRVTSAPVPGDNPDLALPVTTDRWVVCRRDRVTLRGTSSQRWSASLAGSGLVVDGAILFDGRGVGLLVQSGSDAAPRYQLVIAGLHEPVVHHRITLSGVEVVRFAPSRGFALLAVARRLLLVDLRFGRVIKEHDLEHAITDIAIDDAAQHIALRTGDNIEHLSMTALLSAASRRATVEEEVAGAPLAPPAEEDAAPAEEAPAPEPAPQDFHRNSVPLESADALTPRPRFEPTTRGESLALLDRYRDLVVALVGRAIALAWDQGRLTFPADGGLPYRTEVAGLLGRTDGIARGDVESAERFVAEALAAVRAAESATGERRSPLEAIAREFELSTMGRLILLVVAAPSLWGETARLYGILANDEHRPLCDELLVHHVLGPQTNRHDIARELDRDGPLIRYGLVRAGEGRIRPFLSLSVDPILARLFRGADATRDPDDIRIVTADKSFDDLLVPGATKDKVARLVSVPTSTPNRIVVRGRIGSGRHTLLAILGAVAGRKLGVIDATAMVRDLRGRGEQLRAAMRRAHLLGLLPCIDGLEAIGSEDQITREGVRELLRHHPGPLAVRLPWDAEPPLDPGHILVDLPALSVVQRIACWKHTLGASGLAVNDPEELALRYRVGPGVITRVCSQVATERTEKQPERSPDGELDVAARIDHAIRQHLDSRLTATPDFETARPFEAHSPGGIG